MAGDWRRSNDATHCKECESKEKVSFAEDVVADPNTLDLAMVLGSGWAPHRGGPIRYAQDRGLANVVDALNQLAKRHGDRFAPCKLLYHWAQEGRVNVAPSLVKAGGSS